MIPQYGEGGYDYYYFIYAASAFLNLLLLVCVKAKYTMHTRTWETLELKKPILEGENID